MPGPSNTLRWDSTATVRDVVGTSSAPNLSNLTDTTGIVTVATDGTLKVDGICWDNGTNTFAATFIATTQDNAVAQGYDDEGANPLNISDGPVEISEDIAANTSTANSFFSSDDGSWAAENSAGTLVLDGFGNQQVVGTGRSGQLQVLGLPGSGGRPLVGASGGTGRGAPASRPVRASI